MFSAARTITSRVVLRTASANANNNAFGFLKRQPQTTTTLRHFAASTFLDPSEVTERILTVVKNFEKVDSDKVTPSCKFQDDLGLDSLDGVEVVMAIEDEFAIEIPDAEADKILSVADAIEYVCGHPMAK